MQKKAEEAGLGHSKSNACTQRWGFHQAKGQTPLLKAYANLLGPSANPLYPLCKEGPQIIAHWLRRCPRLDATRQNIFGSLSPHLKVLITDSERVLAVARVTLVLKRRNPPG